MDGQTLVVVVLLRPLGLVKAVITRAGHGVRHPQSQNQAAAARDSPEGENRIESLANAHSPAICHRGMHARCA